LTKNNIGVINVLLIDKRVISQAFHG